MKARDLGPALLATALAVAGVLVRPPLPIDETRYVQVFEESLRGSAVLLRLLGEPYGEKPPLLLWLAWPLTWLGASPATALRLIPALATGLTVAFATRIGRRAGLQLVGWVQCALLFSLLYGNLLLFDPLLACAVLGATLGWLERRPLATFLGIAATFLAKGPVAAVFLVAYGLCLAPLRAPGPRALGRSLGLLAAGLLPLAAWALGAAWLGGSEFARALLWERWAGRVVQSFDHQRALWFYVPVLLIGGLPGLFVLFQRGWFEAARERGWPWRAFLTGAGLLVFFSLVSGKQPHYLLPLSPLLALLVAFGLEQARTGSSRLRWGLALELVLLALLLVGGFAEQDELRESTGPQGLAYLERGGWILPVALGAAALGVALGVLLRARTDRGRLGGFTAGAGVFLLCLHAIAGRLLFPHDLEQALERSPEVPVTYLGSARHGLYALLSDQRALEALPDAAAIEPWSRAHPEGLILVNPLDLGDGLPAGLDVLARDIAHRRPVVVLRRAATAGR